MRTLKKEEEDIKKEMATFVGEEDRQQTVYEVIIVGAGISSLTANHALRTKYGMSHKEILILEAQDYIGGRIRQGEDFVPNGLIELGAEILHGEETVLTQFGREMGEPMKSLYVWAHGDGGPMEAPVDRHYGLYYSAQNDRLLRFDAEDADFQHLNETLWKIPEHQESDFSAETTLEDYLRAEGCSEEMISMANAGFANTLCTKSNILSLRQVIRWGHQWETEGEHDGDFKFKGTFRALINYLKRALVEEAQVLLNTPVLSITRHCANGKKAEGAKEAAPDSLVTVATVDGRHFRAKTVLVTASIYVLQHPELLHFVPPLPAQYTQALQMVTMNKAMKVFTRYSAPFWPVGLQGMIMAPPSAEASEVRSAFVPECWFNALPCAAHEHCYTDPDPSKRRHPDPICGNCNYYVTGFITSDFAGHLDDTYEDDADICQVVVQQLDRVFAKLTKEHHLRHNEYLDADHAKDGDADSTSSESTTPEERAEAAAKKRQQLQAFEAPQLPLPSAVYTNGRVQRWTPRRHPYIGGGYASGLAATSSSPATATTEIGPGDYARILSAKGLDDCVFFAGEGVNFPAGATAHAAMESAMRAADNIAEQLQRRPLDSTVAK